MTRKWLGWLFWWAAILVLGAEFFAESQGDIRAPFLLDITVTVMGIALAIIFAFQVRKGVFPSAPAKVRTLPLGKLMLIGVGLILASFVWFAVALFSEIPPTAALLPFFILLMAGIGLLFWCAGMKFYKIISR